MRWFYACKVRKVTVFIKGIYISVNSRIAGLVRPNIKTKIADMSIHEMILCIKYTTVLYLSKESILQGTHARPNWFARRSKREYQIHAYMRWYYACKVRKGTVFIKGIYTSGNSRMAELVRSNIQKKRADTCIDEMILCMESTQRCCIYQSNLYFSELTHGRTGWPEDPKENSRHVRTWDDIMHVSKQGYCIYQRNLYFSELTHGRNGSP